MKKPFVIFFKDGQMMAFEEPVQPMVSFIDFVSDKESRDHALEQEKLWKEYKEKVKAFRLSSLPISKESEEKVKDMIPTQIALNEHLSYEKVISWQPDQTKEYQIEVELIEEWERTYKDGLEEWKLWPNAMNDSDEDKMFYAYRKVLVLIEDNHTVDPKLQRRSEDLTLLQQYSEFLQKNDYLDYEFALDWIKEGPEAIDEFLKQRYGKNA